MSARGRLLVLLAILACGLALPAGATAIPCDPGRCASFDAPGALGPVVAGPDGNRWFLGDGFVGRMDAGGGVTRFPAPVGAGSDLVAGADGALYFTGSGVVGRMATDGTYTLTRTGVNAAGPLAASTDGTVLLGAAGNSIVRLRGNDIVGTSGSPLA